MFHVGGIWFDEIAYQNTAAHDDGVRLLILL